MNPTTPAGREDAFVYSWLAAFGEYEAVLRKRWDPFGQLIVNRLAYCMLIPKALWHRVGGYDETMRMGCEDWDFNIRLGLTGGAEGLCLAEPLFHYRASADGMMRSVTHRHYGAIWRHIQKKYPDVYRAPDLLRRMRASPDERRRAWTLLAFYGVHRLLPDALFSAFFRTAVLLRNRLRAARTRGRPPHDR